MEALNLAPSTIGHASGSEVLLFNGYKQRVEGLNPGDMLMGPDSKPRVVRERFLGTNQLFRVTPSKGDPFVVTKDHVLTLKRTGQGADARKGEVVNVPIAEYMHKSNHFKHVHKLYRSGCDFYPYQGLPVDPWLLGVILGDGCITGCNPGVRITTIEREIYHGVNKAAAMLGLSAKVKFPRRRAPYVVVTSEDTRHHSSLPNPLTKGLKDLGLWGTNSGTKFIPHCYKTATLAERQAVLAGIIDTDGHKVKGPNGGRCYEVISKSKNLAEDTAFIARSIGCSATVKRKLLNGHPYYRVYFGGVPPEVGCKITRKKPTAKIPKKNPLITGIKVEHIGEGPFVGFRINGDRHYLAGDFSVMGGRTNA